MLTFAEGAVTKLRREFKLVLEPEAARRLCQQLSCELGGVLPPPTRITSVYFDRAGLNAKTHLMPVISNPGNPTGHTRHGAELA